MVETNIYRHMSSAKPQTALLCVHVHLYVLPPSAASAALVLNIIISGCLCATSHHWLAWAAFVPVYHTFFLSFHSSVVCLFLCLSAFFYINSVFQHFRLFRANGYEVKTSTVEKAFDSSRTFKKASEVLAPGWKKRDKTVHIFKNKIKNPHDAAKET